MNEGASFEAVVGGGLIGLYAGVALGASIPSLVASAGFGGALMMGGVGAWLGGGLVGPLAENLLRSLADGIKGVFSAWDHKKDLEKQRKIKEEIEHKDNNEINNQGLKDKGEDILAKIDNKGDRKRAVYKHLIKEDDLDANPTQENKISQKRGNNFKPA